MFLLGGIVLLSGCGKSIGPQENYGYSIFGDTVRVLDSNWGKNIHVVEAKSIPYRKEVVTAGTVRPIPTLYANIAPPFAGRVLKSHVCMGQYVEQGTPIFEIVCADFTTAQKDYYQAQSSRELALKDLKRKRDLAQNGVCSQKELEEAENSLFIAEKDFENAQSALHIYQVEDISSMKLGQPLVVRAPISGLIIENNIVTGQYLKDDTDPIAVVADLSKVWVSAQVKEKDIRFIKEGADLNIEISAYPGVVLKGTVFHIEEALDEDTRSICVLSECQNEDEMLKLGMYTTVHFFSDIMYMIEIPETALLQGTDDNFVYVQVAPNTFVQRKVKVEVSSGKKTIISEGLKPGEKIIGEGGYYLKL